MGFLKDLFGRFRKRDVPPPEEDDVSTVGWDAIDAAVEPLYPGQEPQHWGTLIKWMLGGRDPLDGISAYRADGPPPHWHFVTYGMTDLYTKNSEDPEVSGWGFEFTLRLARGPANEAPPMWAVNLLQNIGRYVFDSGNAFGHGHYLDCNGPIALEEKTDLAALLFFRDPELPPIDTPHGRVEFLQAIGITADEYEACRAWNSEAFAEVLRASNPLLITDLSRKSILTDPELARRVAEGQARDGSSSAALHVDALSWRSEGGRYVVEMTANGFGKLPVYLRGRLDYGRELTIIGADRAVHLKSGSASSVSADEDILIVTLSPDGVSALAGMAEPRRGTYEVEGLDLVFEVRPSLIRDAAGNVVREVG